MIIENKTKIIASDKNIELINIFFKANLPNAPILISTYRVSMAVNKYLDSHYIFNERFYNAIKIDYNQEDEFVGVLLINLIGKHHGLENMLIDYLLKLGVYPIVPRETDFIISATDDQAQEFFKRSVLPKMPNPKSKYIKRIINEKNSNKELLK